MREDDLVSRRGGLILVVFGVALTAVAVAKADQSALAAILAFGGIAAVVIGVLFGRMEGDFELSATSVKARLAAVTDVVQREDLTLEDKGEQVVGLVRAVTPRHGRLADDPDIRPPTRATVDRAIELKGRVRELLTADGWIVASDNPGLRFDFRATRPGDRPLYVDVKARWHLDYADVDRLLRSWMGWQQADQEIELARLALAVAEGALSAKALERLRHGAPAVELIQIRA